MKTSNNFWIFLLIPIILLSCKKEDDTNQSGSGSMNMIFTKADVLCFGGNDGSIDITVQGGKTPYSYAWSNGSSNEDLIELSAESYIVDILDSDGYLLTDTIFIEQPEAIQVIEIIYPDLLELNVNGGTPPYSYLWSTGDTTQNLSNHNYQACSVTVTDANNCSAMKEFFNSIVLDGSYVLGLGTALGSLSDDGLMTVARNEVRNSAYNDGSLAEDDRPELKEIYMAIKGGTDGFNIVEVEGSSHKTYGPDADFTLVPEFELDLDEPKAGVWRGSLVETTNKFNVPEDGLYHIAYDKELMVCIIAKVEWGVIGAATPGGWVNSTFLPSASFDLNTMIFEANDIIMTHADWKFRYSSGWKVILDEDYDLGNGYVGIKVNANLGGTIDDLIPGGFQFTNDYPGLYTIAMNWTLGEGHSATVIKTGEIPYFDYTDTELGLIGDGLMVNGSQHNWDETIMLSTPLVESETNYTWTYDDVEVTTLGSFKIREGQTWEGINLGYPDVSLEGLAVNDFEGNGDGNFYPLVDGFYDMELFIDASTESYILTVNPSGAVIPELYMVGDGTPAGWDIDNPVPLEGTGGEYTITADLPGEGGIKFVTTPGMWQPQYGTELGATWDAGILLLNDGTGTDPEAIPGPPAGTYTITVNTNTMTYTVIGAK